MNLKLRIIGYFFALLACLFLVVALPSVLPLIPNPTPFKMPQIQTSQQKQSNVALNNENGKSATAMSIFQNNFVLSLIALIPLLGWSFLLAVLWRTGLVVASYSSLSSWVLTKLLLFMFIELSVYSFAVLQSISFIQLFRKRKTIKPWHPIFNKIVITIAVMGLILFFSAFLEIIFIHI